MLSLQFHYYVSAYEKFRGLLVPLVLLKELSLIFIKQKLQTESCIGGMKLPYNPYISKNLQGIFKINRD